MTRTLLAACGAVVLAGLTAAAQTPQTPRPSTSDPSSPSQSSKASADTVTLTGCLARGDGSGSAAASSAPASSSTSGQYILTKATKGASTSAPSSSSARDESRPSDAMTYALKADGSTVDLSKHVGHKIQVTGTMDTASSSSGSAASTSKMAFKVSSLTMISASCD